MSVLLGFGTFVFIFLVGTYFGVLIYAKRDKIYLAWKVLRGRVTLNDENKLSCTRQHVEPNYVSIKETDYKQLVEAAHELKIARGYIAHAEAIIPNPNKTTYAETVNDVFGKS